MPKYEKHIFICANQRDPSSPRGSCDPAGSAELQRAFKEKLQALGLKRRFRANKAGCLDQCEHGPTVVVYPDAVWYGRVSKEDVEEIVASHLLNDRPVERLLLQQTCINTEECNHRKPKR
jgi:(2Fe-2S) ferredoxin